MFYESRPTVFVLAHSDNGTMITSYMDWEATASKDGVLGVTVELFNKSSYDPTEIEFLCHMLDLRRSHFGDGVVAVDGGANIGCYALPFAKHMTGWGQVMAFEPQERLFYALAGNIALNNTFNVRAHNAALGAKSGTIGIPAIDYSKPRNLGGVRMVKSADAWQVPLVALNDLDARVDLLKLDIEGMEIEALEGAAAILLKYRPILYIEHIICGEQKLREFLEPRGYAINMMGMNVIGLHRNDPVSKQVNFVDKSQAAA